MERVITRRNALRAAAIAAGGLVLSPGCALRKPYVVDPAKAGRWPRRFARVHVDAARIIRTVVGLRPFRPAGFVVRAESLGNKLLIHNYGHGGGGVTLSWGTAHLAVDELARSSRAGAAAVLGCGAVGLATARLLQRRGVAVTIYARDLPPNTTSNIAGASWFPSHVFDDARRTPAFDAQFERAARLAYREFQMLVGNEYGVHWREQYFLSDTRQEAEPLSGRLPDVFPASAEIPKHAHPFPAPFVYCDSMMFIEPSVYLAALLRDFYIAGGRLVVRAFREVSELSALVESVAFNCTGLGARELFGDGEMTPVKGQLTVLVPQPEVDYAMVTNDLYMFPRTDGIILGGTFERGVETFEPNPDAAARILAGHRRIFDGMR